MFHFYVITGGYDEYRPFVEIPSFLTPTIEKVSEACNGARFNAILIRLYFDGNI
jgi:hypothetical protein